MNTQLHSLYQEYNEKLADSSLVMQDDILKIVMQIESAISEILRATPDSAPLANIDEKRIRRYHLDTPHAPHVERTAREASVLHQELGIHTSVNNLLTRISNRQKSLFAQLDATEFGYILTQLGIVSIHHKDGSSHPFVPTTGRESAPITGSGNGMESESSAPKFLELLAILRTIETPDGGFIDTRDIIVDYQTETPDNMMRTMPYSVIRIPRLGRTILLSERIGEATFIFQGLLSPSIFKLDNKTTLQSSRGGKRIIYGKMWWEHIVKALTENWDPETLRPRETDKVNAPQDRVNIDQALLFIDPDALRDHLTRFAHAVNPPLILADLTTTTPKRGTSVTLSSGQEMTWQAFLNHASQYLLGTKEHTNNPHRKAEALDLLLDMIGVIRTNEAYFKNPEYIRKDLDKFAKAAWVALANLTTSTPKEDTSVALFSGQKIAWETFLNQASGYLLGTRSKSNNPPRKVDALDLLLDMIGVVRVNEAYFKNPEYIRKDLDKFAKAAWVALANLTTSTPKQNTSVILSSGQEMRWNAFLNQASQYLLGTKKRSNNLHRQAEALDRLFEMIGERRNASRDN